MLTVLLGNVRHKKKACCLVLLPTRTKKNLPQGGTNSACFQILFSLNETEAAFTFLASTRRDRADCEICHGGTKALVISWFFFPPVWTPLCRCGFSCVTYLGVAGVTRAARNFRCCRRVRSCSEPNIGRGSHYSSAKLAETCHDDASSILNFLHSAAFSLLVWA